MKEFAINNNDENIIVETIKNIVFSNEQHEDNVNDILNICIRMLNDNEKDYTCIDFLHGNSGCKKIMQERIIIEKVLSTNSINEIIMFFISNNIQFETLELLDDKINVGFSNKSEILGYKEINLKISTKKHSKYKTIIKKYIRNIINMFYYQVSKTSSNQKFKKKLLSIKKK